MKAIESPAEYEAAISELSELMFRDTDHPRIRELAEVLHAYEDEQWPEFREACEAGDDDSFREWLDRRHR